MCAEGDNLLRVLGALDLRNHIVRRECNVLVLYSNLCAGCTFVDDLHSVHGAQLYCRCIAERTQRTAQLALMKVGILEVIVNIAVHGDDSCGARFHQAAVQRHAQGAVDEHNLALDVQQVDRKRVFHVDKICRKAVCGGAFRALVTAHGVALTVRLQNLEGRFHFGGFDLKRLNHGGQTEAFTLRFQDFRGF